MTPIRRDFFKHLAYVGIGVIPIILLSQEKGPERFIALGGFIFSLVHLIAIVKISQAIVDDFFPPKTYNKTKAKPFDKLVNYLAMGLFFIGLVFEVFEIKRIDNTIGGMRLFWTYAFIGVLIALLATIILKRISPSIYFESSRRYTVYFGLFLGFFLLIPALASFLNRSLGNKSINCKEYAVVRKSTGGKQGRTSWIFVKINEQEERFEVPRNFWSKIEEEEHVILCTETGKLGHDFVTEFKTVDR